MTAFLSRPVRRSLLAPACLLSLIAFVHVEAASAAATVSWQVFTMAEPTRFSPADSLSCEAEGKCDQYDALVLNTGDAPSTGTVMVTDTLPSGMTARGLPFGRFTEEAPLECTGAGQQLVTCTFEVSVPPGAYFEISVPVSAPGSSMSGSLSNAVTVSGGGAATPAGSSLETPIDPHSPEFALQAFRFSTLRADGTPELQAGAHPWQLTSVFAHPVLFSTLTAEAPFAPAANPKDVVVELPPGLVGDPQVVAQCSQTQLRRNTCPPSSRIGAVAFAGARLTGFTFTESTSSLPVSALYNMTPEAGYPAEFAFQLGGIPVYLYASVVHGASGYHLRIADPGVPTELGIFAVAATFYGQPGRFNGDGNAEAFLTNPTDCAASMQASRIEVDAWEQPGLAHEAEQTVYPALTGCEGLRFEPTLAFAPRAAPEGTTQADTPSGYDFDLEVPQTSQYGERATPEPRDVSVVLPAGVSVSPSAASGLAGCAETGPQGIDLPRGQRRATEAGEGEAIGSDGLSHLSAGHCPPGSTLGTVEVATPLLPPGPGGSAPLQGHLYLAQPACGGEGQPACTDASATNGELFSLYIELEGHDPSGVADGVVVKLKGSVSANPNTGQLTATFHDAPQLPFSELRIHLDGGERAPLANPQNCGIFTTTSDLVPWSGPVTPDATPSFSFAITGCAGPMPFAPTFDAGTITPAAATSSPFTLTISRGDGQQNFSAISTTLAPGLVGMVSQVPVCGEPQAGEGTCPEASRIGTTTVAAGSGTQPYWLSGRVYLTGPYHGAPFGLSVVVPAKAGPFNLGNVVVRAAINVDPSTSAISVTSAPLPQIRDGVPFRLKTINVTIDRPGFMMNPTNCEAHTITGEVAAAQGAKVSVSSPFQVANCATLPFGPKFTVLTHGRTSKANGAYLHVKVTSGAGQANIGKVKVDLPKQLPSRLTTLQKACPDATFKANPASCPGGSVVGTATAVTPVLKSPLTGPAYLVSHAGAAFPDLVIVLQGEGITLDLAGNTNIKKGVTISTFNSLPDAPISTFDLVLPEGPHSALAAHGNLCRSKLGMPTAITGQNGAVIKQTTRIAVAGCPKHKKARRAKTHRNARRAKG